jgi:quercetin dioxygenase-like cupin family protein
MLNRRDALNCALCGLATLTGTPSKTAAKATPGFTRKILQRTELQGEKYVCLLVQIDIDPDGFVAPHTHPGIESSYFTAGGGVLSVRGQPDRTLGAGEGFQVPPEVVHSVRNGSAPSRVIATFTVDRDKPLATPA